MHHSSVTCQLLRHLALHLTLGPPASAQVELPQLLEQGLAVRPQLVHLRVVELNGGIVAAK